MDCHYVKCSVKSDDGIEQLIETIINKSMDLENQIVGTSLGGSNDKIFSLGGSDGLTSGDISKINPMKLETRKKKAGCCAGSQ